MRAFPESGRIDREWLETATDEDPWLLVSTDINNPEYRDALIGNGLIGLRVPPEGEGEAFVPSGATSPTGCLMHGLWTDDRLMPPPQWHGLSYHDGSADFRRTVGQHEHYVQTLDMRTATLTTQCDWMNDDRRTAIATTLWLSLADERLLVIETRITPDFAGEVAFTDGLYAVSATAGLAEIMAARYHFGEDGEAITLQMRAGERCRRVACHAVVDVEGAAATTTTSINRDPTAGQRGVVRTTRFAVRAGTTYTVRRIAALASDAEGDDPAVLALQSVAGARADLAAARAAHEAAWAERWASRIEVGNQRLQRVINAALYQCYAQLPAGRAHSVGPAALSGMSWHGRAFWDADLWTFPVVGLLHPALGRCFTAYRAATIEGARRNAAGRGYAGACFAWESAETGDEKVPAPAVHHQRHVNACVALAQWWDRLITGDEDYFRTSGAEVIIEAARYFADRVHFNAQDNRYELRHIKCPDEHAGVQDNNATTNYACVATLRLAQRACAILGQDPDPQWSDICANMWVPFDAQQRRFIEYEGFDAFGEYSRGLTKIKQADTTLLVYPWEMPMANDVKTNTLTYYRSLYNDNKIMMASAIDGIVDCELGDTSTAWASLCDLLPHVRGPFMLVSESPVNETLSFITGLGGLLQLVVMGFAGLRIHEDALRVKACLPEAVGGLRVLGAHYRGARCDIVVDADGARVIPAA